MAIQWIDLTLATPQENLSADEAFLDECEEGDDVEILRFWESPEHFVVLGYSNNVAAEVNVSYCEAHSIPVLRRHSGGGAVVQGPGCLNYALILKMQSTGPLSTLSGTNAFIMARHRDLMQSLLGETVEVQGHTDLTLHAMKFSGNAQWRKHRTLLFHGCFLLHFDIPLVENILRLPAKQPMYRSNRSHEEFMTNVPVSASALKEALRLAWGALEQLNDIPRERIQLLARTRYASPAWNLGL
jgi:lipoate---protein ligase